MSYNAWVEGYTSVTAAYVFIAWMMVNAGVKYNYNR